MHPRASERAGAAPASSMAITVYCVRYLMADTASGEHPFLSTHEIGRTDTKMLASQRVDCSALLVCHPSTEQAGRTVYGTYYVRKVHTSAACTEAPSGPIIGRAMSVSSTDRSGRNAAEAA